jgi:hypothetical protein
VYIIMEAKPVNDNLDREIAEFSDDVKEILNE